MGLRPVTTSDPLANGSWRLHPSIASDVQGLVVSGFGDLPRARAFFLDCAKAPGGAWLKALRAVAPITPADGPQRPAAMIAFTAPGLAQLGLGRALPSFLPAFREGMMQPDRRRRLGDCDARPGVDTGTITAGGLAWSGNGDGQTGDARTPATVHALLMIYEAGPDTLEAHAASILDVLDAHRVTVVRHMELDVEVDKRGISNEHFGFADAISQPVPYDPTHVFGARDPIHGVPLGEVLLGYPNAHGEVPPGPVLPQDLDIDASGVTGAVAPNAGAAAAGGGAKAAISEAATSEAATSKAATSKAATSETTALKAAAGASGLDIGRNGSYLVVRELRQDVPAFWKSLDLAAADLNMRAGDTAVDADWLAERVVGRTQDGHLLGPSGPCPPLADDLPDNAPLYFKTDRHGFGCPIGSHVRRANPRDGLAGRAADCGNMLDAGNAHRILRRGRKFGAKIEDDRVDDGQERGLLFMCLNTDIPRQFEFVQQNWMLNPNFGTLYQEVDPLVGPKGGMTLPREPLRRVVNVATYVTLTGGDYFFLPSVSALDHLQSLREPTAATA